MSGFFALLKLNIRGIHFTNAHRKGRVGVHAANAFLSILLFLLGFAAWGGLVYAAGMFLVPLGGADLILMISIMLFVLISSITTFFSARAIVFGTEDIDFIQALPLPQHSILLSRLGALYIENLFLSFVFLLSSGIALTVNGANLALLPLVVSCFFISLLPTSIGLLFSGIISLITSRMHHKNAATFLLSMLAFIAISFFQLFGNNALFHQINAKQTIGSMQDVLSEIFPPLAWSIHAMSGDTLSLAYTCLFNLVPFLILVAIFSHFYKRILAGLATHRGKSSYTLGEVRTASSFKALLKKEFHALTAYPNVLMIPFAALICLIATAVLIMSHSVNFSDIVGLFDYGGSDKYAAASVASLLFILFSCGLCNYSAMSITLEGRSFWLTKLLPEDPLTILSAKATLNIILNLIIVAIGAPLFCFAMGLPLIDFFCILIIVSIYSIGAPFAGVYLNLKHPRLNMKNVEVAARGNPGVKLYILMNLLSLTICICIFFALRSYTSGEFSFLSYAAIIGIVFILLGLISHRILKTSGVNIFKSLY